MVCKSGNGAHAAATECDKMIPVFQLTDVAADSITFIKFQNANLFN